MAAAVPQLARRLRRQPRVSAHAHQSSGFLDRDPERDVLQRLVAGVRAGQSRVLVLRGEAGVGKTALLRHLAANANGCRVARAAGVQSEMELPFAGLHALCARMLGRLGHLPSPQRDALGTAFGLSAGPPPDRFLVGLAVLSLLADAAEEQPLVVIVDDAQWLDRVSAETLAFVARRLLAERVGLVFALRESGDEHVLDGLPELVVAGLAADEARLLLDAAIPGPLDEHVKARILGEAGGNPLALTELPRGLTPAELAGGFGLPDARPLASRIEHTFLRRAETLPRDTQLLLLTAAAEPVGDLSLLWRAAGQLGIGDDAGRQAEAAGLIELDARVRFPHPLVRSAVYRASHAERPPRRAPGARRRDRSGPRSRPSRLASRARDGDAGRGGGGGDGPLGRARTGPWRAGRGRRVPAAGRRADAGRRPARRALARRGPGEARRRRRRVRLRPPRRRRARAGRRAPARAAGAVGRADRVHEPARARRAAAAARGGPAARSPRRQDGPRDLPRGDRVGDVRRAPRHRPG